MKNNNKTSTKTNIINSEEEYLFEFNIYDSEYKNMGLAIDLLKDVGAKYVDSLKKSDTLDILRIRCTKASMERLAQMLKLPHKISVKYLVDLSQFVNDPFHDALGNRINMYKYFCDKYGKEVVEKYEKEKGIDLKILDKDR